MPFNNTPILPPDEVTGQSTLPMTRVKRTIQADDEGVPSLASSTFLMSIAAELFIQYFTEQGYKVTQAESKRRNIQYRDLATAVSRVDNLQFLSDVVPRTVPFKEAKSRKVNGTAASGQPSANNATLNDQTTLNFGKADHVGVVEPPVTDASVSAVNGSQSVVGTETGETAQPIAVETDAQHDVNGDGAQVPVNAAQEDVEMDN